MEEAVILLSGGLDSSTLLHDLRRRMGVARVRALTFRYGQRHEREIEAARWQAREAGAVEHRVADIGFFGDLVAGGSALTPGGPAVPDLADIAGSDLDQPPTYVPHRNMVLLSLAAAYAEARGIADVFYAAQAQDRYGYWDCTVAFLDALNAVLGLNRRTAVRVHAPYAGLPKAAVLKIALEIGVDCSHTWTCYRGGAAPCRACPSCVERARAFLAQGVPDPLLA
jgi:7-cyano-7-deazaguanine synthase